MDIDPDVVSIVDGAAGRRGVTHDPGDGMTMSSYDAVTGQTVLHHWEDDGSSVSLVYDPWGVVIGAETVTADGDVVQVSGDRVVEMVAELTVRENLPLSCPWGDDRMVCQVPLDADLVTVDDVTTSDAYVAWQATLVESDVSGHRMDVAGDVIGDVADADFWFRQSADVTCGPAAATQIIEDFTGVDLGGEAVVAAYAADQGWLGQDGMDSYRLADLLTRFGVPATVQTDQTWQDIVGYLAEGRSVVMTVDAYDYWEGAGGGDEAEDSAADGINHFVRVVAVDVERGVAVLSDSSTPDGRQLEVPLAALEEAWDDVTSVDEYGNPVREHLLVVSDAADRGIGRRGGLFGNPHGWVVVPAVLAASRIAGAVRR